ncbi:LPD7 domain-containing protein [Iodobacter fluviatilis]|uniref:Large polyvalent protein-associated domain-containing protein n=1 Tax=Iodobacter fluviatilis TaxID=537 RepID=A0A7G3GFD2_9NEIS|nr:LPD7 domain-containing protein [Iodobacter fluviatilis]QBC45899.1 hypothetical protein C1H71_20365 [Iodobacter fluviatilis]
MNTENVETPVAPKKSKAIEAEFRVKDEANDLVYLKKSLPDAIEVADKIGVTHFQSYSPTSRKIADYEKSEIGWSRNGKSFDMPVAEKTEASEPKPESNKDQTKAQGAEIITLDDRTRNLLSQARKLDSFKAGGSPSEVVRTDFEADSSDGLTPAARRMLAENRALDAVRAKLALGDRGDAELASESKEKGVDVRLLPEQVHAKKHVDEKFYVVAGKYHHRATPDKVAFEHDKNALGSERLKTQNATIEVAKDMAAVAKAEGWKSLTVTGNEEFKRQVWLDAQSSGIEVKGYRPTDLDRLLLEEKIKAKEKDPLNNKQYGEVQKLESAKEKVPGQDQQQNASNVVDFKKKDQSHEGNVVDYGHAPYKFEKDEKPSFYVTLKTTAGTKTIWGKDLENGIKKSNVQRATM